MSQITRVPWRVSDTIRNKSTGHPYLVLHISRYYCTLVDLEESETLAPTLTLLPRDYSNYARDIDMDVKKNDWYYYPVAI